MCVNNMKELCELENLLQFMQQCKKKKNYVTNVTLFYK